MNKLFFSPQFITLAWTFGELFLLVGLQWVYYDFAKVAKKSIIPFLVVYVSICIFCVWLHFGAKPIIEGWLNTLGGLQWAHSTLVWDFFVTLWAVIEGFVMLYVVSIYFLIKGSTAEGNETIRTFTVYGTFIKVGIVILLTSLYILYHYYAFNVYGKYSLRVNELKNILIFFRRIIGVFWVAFEWTIAIFIFKVYFLLNRMK